VVDKLSDKFQLSLDAQHFDRNKIEAVMEVCLRSVKKKYPEEAIEIVAGLFGRSKKNKPESYLYKADSRSCCTSLEKHYCSAGTGDNSLANFILSNTYSRFPRFVTVSEALSLGVFVTSAMKEYADGVGGPTRVFYVDYAMMQWVPLVSPRVAEIEKIFTLQELEESVSSFWRKGQSTTQCNR